MAFEGLGCRLQGAPAGSWGSMMPRTPIVCRLCTRAPEQMRLHAAGLMLPGLVPAGFPCWQHTVQV